MKMSIDDFELKENRVIISERVKKEIKDNNLSNKSLAIDLGYAEDTIARKNKNTNGSYYNRDDLSKLSNIFNCRLYYLACIDNYRTPEDAIGKDKDKLRKDYEKAIEYFKSIGILLDPGIFWYGTKDQYEKAKDKLLPYLTTKSKNDYQKNKANYKDNMFYLRLNSNPLSNGLPNPDELKTRNLPNKNFDAAFITEDRFWLYNNYNPGIIRLRFSLFLNGIYSDPIILSIEETNKLFSYIDKSIIDTVKNLIDSNLINTPKSNDFNVSYEI